MKLISLTLVFLTLFSVPGVVLGQAAQAAKPNPQTGPVCGARGPFVQWLTSEFGEVRTGYGLAAPGPVFELWVNPVTGTYTALATGPDGGTCILFTGVGWEDEAQGDPA